MQPRGEQRVAAEVEEAVVDADLRDAEHLGEQAAQQPLLARSAGRPAGGVAVDSGSGSARRSSLPFAVNGKASSITKAAGTM